MSQVVELSANGKAIIDAAIQIADKINRPRRNRRGFQSRVFLSVANLEQKKVKLHVREFKTHNTSNNKFSHLARISLRKEIKPTNPVEQNSNPQMRPGDPDVSTLGWFKRKN